MLRVALLHFSARAFQRAFTSFVTQKRSFFTNGQNATLNIGCTFTSGGGAVNW